MDSVHELRRIAEEARAIRERLSQLRLDPLLELETLMGALESLKSLEPRLDAIAAAIGTDTATAVAAATAPLNQQISDLQAAAATTESSFQAEADTLAAKTGTIETNLGISPTPPADPPAAATDQTA